MKYDESNNVCVFSPCRTWRYTLTHTWRTMFESEHAIVWIALNPSTADEQQLDPTLRRIRAFSQAWGYNTFIMLNAFAFRATDPRALHHATDPVGPENDAWLTRCCHATDKVICAWGTHATLLDRHATLINMLRDAPLYYLEKTKDDFPKHPLYLKSSLRPQPFFA